MILSLFLIFIKSRDPRVLFIDNNLDGDCFNTPCSMKTAALVIRTADIVHFPSNIIYPTSYPSEFSDLFIQLSLMNTTVYSHGVIVDGRFLAGEMLFQITSHPHLTWTKFENWTFKHFSKPIATRQYTWSMAPYLIFKDSIFQDSTSDLFKMKGGTLIFENCLFKNISGKSIKGINELLIEFIDCKFENCSSLFFHGSDVTFINCIFNEMNGQRGGAIHSIKSTLYIDNCKFINCNAEFNGGAIYIRDSISKFESEISNSCFINNNASLNGTSIYSYLSYIELNNNCLLNNNSIYNYGGEIEYSNNIFDNKCFNCLTKPSKKIIQNDFLPCDTFKWWHLDDLKPGSTIIIDDDDEIDIKNPF